MIDIARLLAQRGAKITIVTTPHNAARFKNVLSRSIESGLPINLVHVKLPYQEAGLPEGQENIDSLDSMELMVPFFKAVNMLEKPMVMLMEEMKPRPNCLISDLLLPYTSKIAKKFNIPKIVFHGMGCFCLLCMHVLCLNIEILKNLKSDKEYFMVPSFPDRVELTKPQVPVETNASGDWKEFLEEMVDAEETSYGVIVNTFQELEPAYVKDYKEARAGKVWSIGPVSLCNKLREDKA
ncbi:UDP-glycosyltransferase 73C4 [Cardamine amara subsp. amara]|uniref:UDP-glycosyltransferase 73C4 n=1 Tax=Cardamine amara subsp. amara TaxID=228776 RepID=A0ABD0Z7T9_CARAN